MGLLQNPKIQSALLWLLPWSLSAQIAPSISGPPGERVVLPGATVVLNANATGTPPLSYQWYFNSNALTAATNASLVLDGVQNSQSGSYGLTVTNNYGSATGVVAHLTVLSNPVPTVAAGWGLNDAGQTAAPTNLHGVVSIRAGLQFVLALKGDGAVAGWGNNTYQQLNLPADLTNAIAVTAGGQHGLGLRADGTVRAWGDNSAGQSAVPAGLSNVAVITAGGFHSLALRSNGTVVAWGNNSYGQATVPPGIGTPIDLSAGGYFSAALLGDGRVVAWGFNGNGQTNVPANVTNAIAISAGFSHCLALLRDGAVAAWGYNGSGQTNVPADLSNVVAIAAGFNHSMALKADGTVAGWGSSANGQSSPPVAATNLLAIAAGNSFNAGITPAPVIRVQPADRLLVPGTNTTFSVQIVSALPASFQWRLSGTNLAGATNASLTLTNVQTGDAGSYSVMVSNHYGAISSSSAVLSLAPMVQVPPTNRIGQIGRDVPFSVMVDSTDPATYQWQFNGANIPGATSAAYVRFNAQPVHVGYYRVRISSSVGATTSAPAWLALVSSNQLARIGDSLSLSITSAVPAAFQWQFNAIALVDQTNRILTLTNLQPAQSGNYRVLADDGVSSLISPDIPVTVLLPPAITNPPVGQVVALGSTATFAVGAAGIAPLKYQWLLEGAPVPQATNSTYMITNCQVANAGNLAVVVTNSYGAVTSAVVSLVVTSVPPWFASHPLTRIAWAGGSATFSASPRGDAPLTQQWLKDGADILGATNASLVLSNLIIPDAGHYSLRASNAFGVGFSSNATLRVIAVPPPGSVLTWGGFYGMSGYVPPDVCGAVAISGATSHSLALLSDGTVRVWGANDFGQLGMPFGLSNVVEIAGGTFHSIVLRQDDSVVAWGDNGSGQATIPASLKRCIAVSAGGDHNVVLQEDGTVAVWGNNYSGESTVPPGLTNVVGVAAGGAFDLALKADGTVVVWGGNDYGQTLVPPGLGNVVAIAAGYQHALALKQDGTVVAWGDNTDGATSVPAGLTGVVAIAAGGFYAGGSQSYALKADGTLVGWGGVRYGALTFPAGLSNVMTVASGATHVLTLMPGLRRSDITGAPYNVTTNAGANVTFSVSVNIPPIGYQWRSSGANIARATNSSVTLTNVQAPDTGDYDVLITSCSGAVTSAPAALTVLPSAPRTAVRRRNKTRHPGQNVTFAAGSVVGTLPFSYQWYSNNAPVSSATNSNLILTNLQLLSTGEYTVAVSNSAGVAFATNSLIVLQPPPMGTVVGWGDASELPPQGISGVTAIAASDSVSLGLRADGNVVAWGINSSGQTNVPSDLSNVIAIAAGPYHGLALRDDGTVAAWGEMFYGQAAPPPGLNEVEAIGCGNGFDLAARSDGTVALWGVEWGLTNIPPAASNVVAVAGGYSHALALRADGTVFGWGDNSYGQVSGPAAESNIIAIAAAHYNSVLLKTDGSVRAFGINFAAQTNVPSAVSNAIAIGTAYGRSYCITADGNVIGWGQNDWGQLSPPASATNLLSVAAGNSHTVVLKNTGISISKQPQGLTVAAGTSITFTVEAFGVSSLTYQWALNGTNIPGSTDTSLSVTNAQDADAGDYSVSVRSTIGENLSAPARLSVLSPPRFVEQPASQIIPADSNVTFWAQATGTPPLRYQWFANGVMLAGMTATNLTLTDLTAAATNTYQLGVTNAYGSITSAPALLIVLAPPQILAQTINQSLVTTSNASFAVSASGTAPLSYRWQFNEADILAATNSVFSLTDAQPSSAGSYRVIVTNAFGAVTSAPAFLIVLPLSPTIVSSPTNRSVTAGSSVPFGLVAAGAAPLSFQWRRDGAPLPGNTVPTFNIPNVQGSDAGIYDAIVTNNFGAVTSAPASLQVGPNANVVAWGLNDRGQTNVPADLTNIVAVAADFSHVLALRADGTVTGWGANDYGQLNIPVGLANVVAVAAGNYHSLALRSDGTVVGWGGNTYGQALPPAGLSNVIGIAAGTIYSLALKNDGTVIGWGYNLYGQASAPSDLTNAVAVAAGSEHSLALRSDGTVAAWGMYYGDGTGISNVVAVSGKTFHFLLLRNDGTVVGAESKAVEGPSNVVAVSAGGYSISAQPHNLAILSNRTVSAWGVNNYGQESPPPGLSNVIGISAGYYFSVAVKGGSEFITQPVSQTVSAGQPVLFSAEVYSFAPTILRWQVNGTNIDGATNSALFLPSAQFAHHGDYSLVASNGLGITRSAVATLTVIPPVPGLTASPANQTVIAGGTAVFSVSAVGVGSLAYQWRFNGYNIPGATGTNLLINNVASNQMGAYSVVVSNVNGANESAPAALIVVPNDLIVDDPQAQVTGAWFISAAGLDKFGFDYLYKGQGPGTSGVNFVPRIPQTGVYEVYEWHPQTAGGTVAAPHFIGYNGGRQLVFVNQQTNGGQWNPLGAFPFSAGTNGGVRISDALPDAAQTVAADAIKFVYVAPPVIVVPPQSQFVVAGGATDFRVTVASSSTLSFQWQKENRDLVAATADRLHLANVQLMDAGAYRVIVHNAGGIATSEGTLNVGVPLKISVSPSSAGLSWVGPFVLQTSTDVSGPYYDVPGAASPWAITLTAEPQRYFRVRLAAEPILSPLRVGVGLGPQLEVSNVAGFQYRIEASADLKAWMPLGIRVAPFTFTDLTSTNFPARFYRAVWAP